MVFSRRSLLPSLALLAATSSTASAQQQIGDEVCYEGYIMDTYCSQVGFFPHATTRSLTKPEVHTVHCLIDDVSCINSGFEVLKFENDSSKTSPYCRAYKFNDVGNQILIHMMKSIGVCTDCYANTTGEWVDGFRATIFGTIAELGTTVTPAIVNVTEVLDTSVGCGDAGGNVEPTTCIFQREGLKDSDSPCHDEGDWCKNLGETKPEAQSTTSLASDMLLGRLLNIVRATGLVVLLLSIASW